ncbi:MAG: FG-GAP repeat domain-containing protein, partial [Candidatus Thorarchaeota archaeon]
ETAYFNWLQAPRATYAADLNGDGVDELIANVERYGVYGFNYLGSEEWRWLAPLVVNSADSTCAFADMDGDGATDLIFTNHNYLHVVSIKKLQLLWHYSTDHRIVLPKPGRFASAGLLRDVVSYWAGNVYVISGTLPTPIPPGSPIPALYSLNFGYMALLAAGVGIPIGILVLLPIAIVWKRKKQRK